MRTQLSHNIRQRLLVLVVAAFLALAAAYTPVLLDGVAGTSLTPTSFACGNPHGGC